MSSGTQVDVSYRFEAGALVQIRIVFGNGDKLSVIPHDDPDAPFEVAWWRFDGAPRWFESWEDDEGHARESMDIRILTRSDLCHLVESLARGISPTSSVLRPDR